MLRATIARIAVPAFFLFGCAGDEAADAGAVSVEAGLSPAEVVLAQVVEAMGTAGLGSITFSGQAWRIRNGWMQTPQADPPWPARDEITNYRRTIDLDRLVSVASGDTFARNIFFDPPTAGIYSDDILAEDTIWSRQLEIWLTPWGFLAGAAANGVDLAQGRLDGVDYRVLSWMSPETQAAPSGLRYTVNAFVNDDNHIAAVETWVDDAFMGDFHVVQVYRDYREMDGLMIPQSIEQQRGGGGVFGVIVTRAIANPTNLSELLAAGQSRREARGAPPASTAAGAGPVGDLIEPIGNRAWLITGGYVALVAEFEDHALVFEAGQSEARGEQILAAVAELLPDKPVRYLVNSHAHSDHTAGIVPFIRAGATLVSHENNVAFLEMALGSSRSLLGEDPLDVRVEGVDEISVFEDSFNRVELHSVPNGHTDGMLVAVLPRQRVLFQADFTLPQPGSAPNPFVVSLAQYVAETNPPFERYLAVHAAQVPQTKADLLATIGL